MMELTYRCNLLCIHCYRVEGDHKRDLSTEEVTQTLDQLAAMGTLSVSFTGGEIFSRRDIFDILEHARRRRFAVTLFTTGTLLTQERVNRLQKLAMEEVHISVYGSTAATHEKITLIPGSFERSLNAIRMLRQSGIRVKIKCPLTKLNFHEYREIILLARSLGTKYAIDPIITPRTDGARDPIALRISQEQLEQVYSDPILFPAVEESVQNPHNEVGDLERAYEQIPCGAGHVSVNINPYGDVTPCVQMPIKLGNLREQSFSEIWNHSQRLVELRAIRVSDLQTCSSCEVLGHCSRCPGLALIEDGDIRGPAKACCSSAFAMKRVVEGAVKFQGRPAAIQDEKKETGVGETTCGSHCSCGSRPDGEKLVQLGASRRVH
jgi:radical SAM protein with 4Fe4S-binding SPASM domain